MNEDLLRWRLVLGVAAGDTLDGPAGTDDTTRARDRALDWLYGRDPELAERDIRRDAEGDVRRGADLAPSELSVPTWITEIHRLFPKETIERLERDAIEEFGIHEVVTNEEVLSRIEPSETLLRAILLTKPLMNPRVLELAREFVRKVVRALVAKLATEVRVAFGGSHATTLTRNPARARFDAKETVRRNLRNWDGATRRLGIDSPRFRTRARRNTLQWQIVLLVDQSGSMVGSVIHTAVTAACLWGLPSVKTHLVAFDTEVVDLTSQVTDPVELLMKVQLGGGTDIARAVAYGASLVENPRRTIVILVSDFYEGGDPGALVSRVKRMTSQGVRFLGLAALDEDAEPDYDRELGRRLVQAGAEIGAMTPGNLVGWLARVMR